MVGSQCDIVKRQGEELSFNTELKKKRQKCYCPKHVKFKVTCSLKIMLHIQREVHQEKRDSRYWRKNPRSTMQSKGQLIRYKKE